MKISENKSRGHLDCKGLVLPSSAIGEAIPTIRSVNEQSELTHEAVIGRISQEELEYLMSEGFTENEAISLIVRGFIEVGLDKIPQALRSYINSVLDIVARFGKG